MEFRLLTDQLLTYNQVSSMKVLFFCSCSFASENQRSKVSMPPFGQLDTLSVIKRYIFEIVHFATGAHCERCRLSTGKAPPIIRWSVPLVQRGYAPGVDPYLIVRGVLVISKTQH